MVAFFNHLLEYGTSNDSDRLIAMAAIALTGHKRRRFKATAKKKLPRKEHGVTSSTG